MKTENKGNYAEKWDDGYAHLRTTYNDSDIQGRDDFVQLLHYECVYEDIVRYIGKQPSEIRTLEVGCGGARVSVYLAKKGMLVTCTDFSREALRLAEANFESQRLTNYTVIQDDLLHSQLTAKQFDVVMSFGLLEHFEDLDEIFRAISRLVAPGGIQIHDIITKRFSVLTVAKIWNTSARFAKRALTLRWRNILRESYHHFPHYENSYSLEQYVTCMERCGNETLYRGGTVIFPYIALPEAWQRGLVRWAQRRRNMFKRLDRSGRKWMEIVGATWWLIGRRNGHVSRD